MLGPLVPVEVPDFSTLRQAQDWFIQTAPRGDGRGTPIDFSRVDYRGTAPVELVGGHDTAPASWQELQADVTRQVRGETP